MNSRYRLSLCLLILGSMVSSRPASAAIIPVTDVITNWFETDGVINEVAANNWALDGTNSFVTHTGYASGVLLSNFGATGDFTFSVRITHGPGFIDNDRFGILIGNNSNNHIRLSMTGTEPDSNISLDQGLEGVVLAREEAGSASVIDSDTNVKWDANESYIFEISRTGDDLNYRIREVGGFYIAQNTFTNYDFSFLDSGDYLRMGVLVDSQDVYMSSFNFTGTSTPAPVPEPFSLSLLGIAGLGYAGSRYRTKSRFQNQQ